MTSFHPQTNISVVTKLMELEIFHCNLTVWPDPCPLCDEAKEVLEPYKHRYIFQQIDITLPENKVWYDKYKYDIPVFHLNGQFLMKHRVNTFLLEKQLAKAEDG
uniref:Glutaredoxin-like protein n=1 Tax=Myripristis murdjan TaxID=586833 RepID=A0A667Y765_9TELE